MVRSHTIEVSTRRQGDAHDLTKRVADAITASGLKAGIVTAFVVGSTAAITTIEFEPGAVADLNRLFEAIAPRGEQRADAGPVTPARVARFASFSNATMNSGRQSG